MINKEPKIVFNRQSLFWTLLFTSMVLGSLRLLIFVSPELLRTIPQEDIANRREVLKFSLYAVLFDYGIRVDWINGNSKHKNVRIPRDLAIHEPYTALVSQFSKLGGTIIRAESSPKGERKIIEVGCGGETLFDIVLRKDDSISRTSGQIAIVIDDFGYSFNKTVKKFLALEHLISISVLPGLKYSKKVCEAAADNGIEVLLHLPMEPANGKFHTSDFMLMTNMTKVEIRRRILKALMLVPNVVGVNNHMGSLATTYEPLLEPLMDELKRAGLFFLDSMTHPNSKAHAVAKSKQVAAVINNTFLDSIKEEPFIRQQVRMLGELASQNGYAVGIGHPDKLTLKVLQDEMPMLEKLGYQFVAVSDLVR